MSDDTKQETTVAATEPVQDKKSKVDDEAAQLAADAEEDVEKLVEKHKRGEVEGNEDEDYEEEEEDDYEEEDSGDDYAGGEDDEEEDFEVEEEDEDDYDDKPKKGTKRKATSSAKGHAAKKSRK